MSRPCFGPEFTYSGITEIIATINAK